MPHLQTCSHGTGEFASSALSRLKGFNGCQERPWPRTARTIKSREKSLHILFRFVQRPKRLNGLDRKDGCLIAWQREAFRLIR